MCLVHPTAGIALECGGEQESGTTLAGNTATNIHTNHLTAGTARCRLRTHGWAEQGYLGLWGKQLRDYGVGDKG
jgi:hypothetical protein